SQEAIARTKSMLVKRVAKGGSAVLNFKDERVKQMAKLREDINIISTGGSEAGIKASEILYDNDGTRFSVHYRDEKELFQTKLLGKHNVENMLLAVGVASCFNVRLKTMAVAARKIKPVEHRLELKKEGGLTIIDDAFNSNPVGAKNAVEILSQFSGGRRIIV